ncbi:MAG: tyrosine--tRNA ligase [Bifidobacteriaceae bacterium]|jgi:tyrosyl-tRNA synthetase|nr:tyrosine--tRNA ligase [Bifidobacteriaceae bacterium]
MSLLEELEWRGLVAQYTNRELLNEAIESKRLRVYIGFDPTAPSLHHGNLVQLILLRHLQDYGNTPVVVVGGATGLIGDPRQSGERKMNEVKVVHGWLENLREQFRKFLEFDESVPNHALMVNNYDWTRDLDVLTFLRDVGKHFRVNNMLAKETVAMRLNSQDGISFTEFSYQILQSYDYLVLHQKYGVNLQCGGNDQWGNLTAGVEFIRKVTGDTVSALTTPIIAKSDGTKFGKSEGGAIWLDPQLMSPFSFYQFWLNIEDTEVVQLLKVFTFIDRSEIEELALLTKEHPERREAQKRLAESVTELVHGKLALTKAQAASEVLFAKADPRALDQETLAAIAQEVRTVPVQIDQPIAQLFADAQLVSSLSDFRRTISSNGLSLNNQTLNSAEDRVNENQLLFGRYMLLKKGKKNYALAKVEK